MSDMDWGGLEWWQIWPPPPGYDDDYYDDFEEPDDSPDYPDPVIPPRPDYPDATTPGNVDPGGVPETISSAWEFLTNLDSVDPSTVRGIAFRTIEEAISWMQGIGVLGFSQVVYEGGLYYPAVPDKTPDPAEQDVREYDYDPFDDNEPIPF